MSDLVERLRGTYRIPVNDGAGPLNGSYEFVRQFETAPIMHEAADRIAELEAENDACLTRQAELLEAIEIECGTGWTCECGHNMYNSYGPTCHDCGRDAPLLNRIAFKLHASHSERPRLAAAEALLRDVRDRFREYEAIHRKKGTPEGDSKAERNAEMADRIDAFLSGGSHEP